MNIAFEPWIPVTMLDGSPKRISVRDALTQGQLYADLAVRPHERVALMRLLLCVSHAALDGPKDFDDWETVPQCLPEAASSYLKKWKDSFELFHPEKPWLQVAGLAKNAGTAKVVNDFELTPISKLFFENATGNNTTLFDHQGTNTKRISELADVVIAMITFQCFSPGGLISQVYFGPYKTSKSSKDAPCVPASMIHAFIRGKNLFETLWLNLLTDEEINMAYGEYPKGCPVWEQVPQNMADTASINNATQTFLGRLVPMARFIKLHPEGQGMLLGDGLTYPNFSDGFPAEASATIVLRKKQKKEERALLAYRPGRAIWRDLAAVMTRQKSLTGSRGPIFLDRLGFEISSDLCVGALARDQANILDTIESVYHIPENMSSSEGLKIYEKSVQLSETIARKLGWAIETYRQEIDSGWEGRLKMAGASKGQLKARLHSIATIHYWTAIEKNLDQLMAIIQAVGSEEFEPAQKSWHSMLYAVARDSYSLACARETPRQMRAFVKGWQKLTARQEDTLHDNPDTNQEDEE